VPYVKLTDPPAVRVAEEVLGGRMDCSGSRPQPDQLARATGASPWLSPRNHRPRAGATVVLHDEGVIVEPDRKRTFGHV
jgi:hypothetical protein